ncbi:MAG: hypothetical protein AAGD17_04370 [Bacteroidota bacterium]|nr:hypothetical protein [uncultured Allomuricauda sp.]
MKKYEVYRNIRKRAMIWGLPTSLFALMMISVVASLLVIIFSFSLVVITIGIIWNATLYILLTRLGSRIRHISLVNPFPKSISNRKESVLDHVKY